MCQVKPATYKGQILYDSFICSTIVVRFINLVRRMLYPETESIEDATSSITLGIDLTEIVRKRQRHRQTTRWSGLLAKETTAPWKRSMFLICN